MRKWSFFALWGALLFSELPSARAESAQVTFGSLDARVVRVFALGPSAVAVEHHDGHPIPVADPIAGHGTGFFVSDDGLVMTAFHVVDGARWLAVRLPGNDGRLVPARVVATVPDDDVAVLEIVSPTEALELAEHATVAVRSNVFAVGYPIDASRRTAQSSRGIVSGQLEDGRLQLDIALNPGNSGGPLVDEHDRVVGMVVARGNVDEGVQNFGFAVPIDRLRVALEMARAGRVNASEDAYASAAECALVDELIQHGSLGEIHVDRHRNVTVDGDLGANVLRLARAVDEPELRVVAAGFLWNAALILFWNSGEVADVTGMGEERLGQQVFGLITGANELAEEAIGLDATLSQRSELARMLAGLDDEPSRGGRGSSSSRGDAPSAGSVGVALALRYNPDTASLGLGGALFAFGHIGLVRADDRLPSFDLSLGFSASYASVPLPNAETAIHLDLAPELGLGGRFGRKGITAFVGLTWAPGLYYARVAPRGESASSDTAFDLTGTHFYAGLAFSRFHVGVGARLISGVLWAEPIRLGANF